MFAKRHLERRADALASTVIIYEIVTIILANVLSVGHHLNPLTASCAYLLLDMAFFKLLPGKKKALKKLGSVPERIKQYYRQQNAIVKASGVFVTVFCMLLFILALFTVPYNYDSMTYHLARIGHWIDRGSIGYYVTNIDRQLFSPVLSEYNLLFIMLLSGSDVLLNLLQFVETVFSAIFIYVILRRLNTGRTFSLLGVTVFLTMPLTISQAITTQNDTGALLWYLIFIYYLMDFAELGRLDPEDREVFRLMLKLGMTVGCAFLMKVSVCASMIWFMPWAVIVAVKRKDRLLSLLKYGMTALLTMAVVVSETLIRTFKATGHLFSPSTSGNIMVATKNVSYIIVNILKNFSLLITQHIFPDLNGVIYRFAIAAGRVLSVEVNNEAISFNGLDFITWLNMGDDMYSHDRTPSAFAAYLVLAGGIMVIVLLIICGVKAVRHMSRSGQDGAGPSVDTAAYPKSRDQDAKGSADRAHISYGFVLSAYLGFGFIMALLRWQPWGSRLMYPALTVAAVAAVHLFGGLFENRKAITQNVLILVLSAVSLIFAIRPLIYNSQVAGEYISSGFDSQKREELMFTSHSHLYEGYRDLLGVIDKTKALDIGLCISGDGYDYPLWKMLKSRNPNAVLRHITVDEEKMQALACETIKASDPVGSMWASEDKGPDLILWIELKELNEGDHFDFFSHTYTCGFRSQAEGAQCYVLYPDMAAKRGAQTLSGHAISGTGEQ